MRAENDNSKPLLLVSDIDDTLTGDPAALRRLWQVLERHRGRLKIALNSSRPAPSVDETLRSYFPATFAPDAVITGLGTEIRLQGTLLSSWSQQFDAWPDVQIRESVLKMGHTPHDAVFQTPGKASFAVPGRERADLVIQRLKDAGFSFKHIFSGKSDLDILAPEAGKDAAMRHLADHLGIALQDTIAAGDSGNDLALFEAAGKAIAVGNARPELLAAMPKDKTYHAAAHHAAGVLEGLAAFNAIPRSDVEN